MTIVEFSDGRYGIRKKFLFWYMYADLVTPGYWWSRRSCYFPDCKVKSLDKAERRFMDINDKGVPIQ